MQSICYRFDSTSGDYKTSRTGDIHIHTQTGPDFRSVQIDLCFLLEIVQDESVVPIYHFDNP